MFEGDLKVQWSLQSGMTVLYVEETGNTGRLDQNSSVTVPAKNPAD